MAGQVGGNTWGGINVPRRCLGRRWQTAASPATTCAAEAIPRDSAVPSVHSYYSLQSEPQNLYEDSLGYRAVRTEHASDSRQESTAWSGVNVPRRSSRWAWSPSYRSTTGATDSERGEDVENGNRVDNQLSPKRQMEMENSSGSSWTETNVPRRSGAYGSPWGNSSGYDSRASARNDSNGNRVEHQRDGTDWKPSGDPETQRQEDDSSSEYSSSRNESGISATSRSWSGINVPQRAGRFGSKSSEQTTKERKFENIQDKQENITTEGQSESWGGIGVPRRTRNYTEPFTYGAKISTREETMETEYSDKSYSLGGINVPKRTSAAVRKHETSISPPRKQHKSEVKTEDNVSSGVSRKTGSFDRNEDSASRQLNQTETTEAQQVGDQNSSKKSQSWGGLNVPKRSSRSSYSSSSFVTSPRQQTQPEYTFYQEKTNTGGSSFGSGRNEAINYGTSTKTKETKKEAEKVTQDEEEVGGYFARYAKRSTVSHFSSTRNEQQKIFFADEKKSDAILKHGGNGQNRYRSPERKIYESQRQPYQANTTAAKTTAANTTAAKTTAANTTAANTENNEANNAQSWSGINVSRRSLFRNYDYNTSPPRQQHSTPQIHPVEKIKCKPTENLNTRRAGDSAVNNDEKNANVNVGSDIDVHQSEEVADTRREPKVTSGTWGGINVPRRTRSIGGSWSSSSSDRTKVYITREEAKNQESAISNPEHRRFDETSPSANDAPRRSERLSSSNKIQEEHKSPNRSQTSWGGIDVPRRSARLSSSNKKNEAKSNYQAKEKDKSQFSNRKERNDSPRRSSRRSTSSSSSSSSSNSQENIKAKEPVTQSGTVSASPNRNQANWGGIGAPRRSARLSSSNNRNEESKKSYATEPKGKSTSKPHSFNRKESNVGRSDSPRRSPRVSTSSPPHSQEEIETKETGETRLHRGKLERHSASPNRNQVGIDVPRRSVRLMAYNNRDKDKAKEPVRSTQDENKFANRNVYNTNQPKTRFERFSSSRSQEEAKEEKFVLQEPTSDLGKHDTGFESPNSNQPSQGSTDTPHRSARLSSSTDIQEETQQSPSRNQSSWGGIDVPRRSSRVSSSDNQPGGKTEAFVTPVRDQEIHRLTLSKIEHVSSSDNSVLSPSSGISSSNGQDEGQEMETVSNMPPEGSPVNSQFTGKFPDSWGGINVPRRSTRLSSLIDRDEARAKKSVINMTEAASSNVDQNTRISTDESRWSSSLSSELSHGGQSDINVNKEGPTFKSENIPFLDSAKSTSVAEETNQATSWSGINVPRRTRSFKSYFIPREPTTNNIPSKPDILLYQQVGGNSMRSHIVEHRRSFNTSYVSGVQAFEYTARSQGNFTKSVQWSNTTSPTTSAPRVSPIMRSRSRSREDRNRLSATELSQAERSRSLMRSRSFTSSSSSRRSESPPKPQERPMHSPTKVLTYQVDLDSSQDNTLNWSWNPASPLMPAKPFPEKDHSDNDDVFEKPEQSRKSRSSDRRSSRKRSEVPESVASSLNSSHRSGGGQTHGTKETVPTNEKEGFVKWSTLEENRKRLASSDTAWEIKRPESLDTISSSAKKEGTSSHKEEKAEIGTDHRWGGVDVPRRCLGYGSTWKSQAQSTYKAENSTMGVHPHTVKSMENDDGIGGQVSEAQLVEWVEEGQDKLNKHDLKGAEMAFWKVLNNTPSIKRKTSSPASPQISPSRKRLPSILENENELAMNRPAVTSLLGLAEVFTKRGRGVRHNDMEWHRMYIQAISSGQQAMTCCNHAMELSPEHKLSEWYSEQKQKSRNDLKVLEDAIVRSVQERLIKKPHMIAGKMLPRTEEDIANPCNMDWLGSFRGHCKERHQVDIDWSKYDFSEEESKEEEKVKEVVKEEPKRKKLDYKKVQIAIQKLVQQIQSEMKTLKIHPGLSPEEKLNLVSPMNENYDIVKAFHKMMSIEERSENENSDAGTETENSMMNGHGENTGNTQPEDGINLGESASEKGISASRALKQTLKGKDRNLKLSLTQVSPTKLEPLVESNELKDSPPMPKDFDRARPKGSFGFTTLNHGVLTVWRSYENLEHNSVDENNPRVPTYSMEAYEELSPLTELSRTIKDGAKAGEDPLDYRNPNTEGNLSVALAHVVRRLADKMKDSKKLTEAMDLYKFALGIYQDYSESNSSMKDSMAHILRNMGIIKCSKGDFLSGSQLLENCISMYESNRSENTDLLVARTWYDLGNAFLSQQWDEHVMQSIKTVLETEVKKDFSQADDLAEDSDDDNSSAGESYWISNQEAIECYKNALALVQKGGIESSENVILYVELLNRIGDCSIASGNYEHAILCYEEAVSMFKTVVGSAMIELNAHALTMLGTANFLMCNFSKAVSMYETANLLHQHIYGSDEDSNFEVAFTLTMLAISFYSMKHYHKSIAWCLKAFELYTNIYQEKFHEAHTLQKWFVIETLYLLGFSYSTLNFHEKSLHYLGISKGILTAAEEGDAKQCVRILKCMADVYQSIGDEENALKLYDEALEWSASLGYEKSATALQNQLLNRMAGVHVNSKDYDTAAKYLEQALDCQKSVENTIKDDLIGIQRQLGVTYTLAGDLDRAIECYTECNEAYKDITDAKPMDVAKNLGTLGTLYHVKACLQEDNDEMFDLLGTAERYYQDALELDSRSSVSVEYANFLYHQEQCADALMAMLPMIHSSECLPMEPVIEYNGLEQAILPDHIHPEVDEIENVVLRTDIFARFLAVLCYKSINMKIDAEDNLIELLKLVLKNSQPLNYSILGHALMEMEMYQEAADSFADSANLQHDNELSVLNYWLALCTWVYTTIEKALRNIFIRQYEEAAKAQSDRDWASGNLGVPGIRDSGYYDHSAEEREEEAWVSKPRKEPISEEEVWEVIEDTVETPAHILELLKQQQLQQEDTMMMSTSDIGYNSTECLPDDEGDFGEQTFIEEETVETPAALLELLKRQQEETDKVLEKLSLSHQNLLEQDEHVDEIEEGLGQRWDRHQEDMEDKSEQILQAITQRQSQLEGMLSTIKRSMENVAGSDTSLNEQKPQSFLTTSSTEDVRRGRLGGGFSSSSYAGRTVSNEDIRRGTLSEFRMSKSSEDLRPKRISITHSSEDILTDALNSYRPASRQRDDPAEETASEVLERLGTKYNTRSPLSGSRSSFNADSDEKPRKRIRPDPPMDLDQEDADTVSRLQRYKQWAERRNIPTMASPVDAKPPSRFRDENMNASNNNDNSFSNTSVTENITTSLSTDNNNSEIVMEDTSSRNLRSNTTNYETSYTEEKKSPVVESRADRMKRYSSLTSSLQTRNPYQMYQSDSTSKSTTESISSSSPSYNKNISSSQQQQSYSQSVSSRSTWQDESGGQDEEEHHGEIWESAEEVVETPPEILQLLRARQQVR